jgi:pyruvate/2-oxoglutarate/acetoin dehydrogenase E1 component
MKNKFIKNISTAEAINDALIIAAKRDKKNIFLCEGLLDPAKFFGTTKNLEKYADKSRLIDIPLSELAITGICIGASMNGLRPILNFQRVEFALLALEQIFNNAAKVHYISFGVHKVPIVIRLVIGRGWGQGPTHSQSLESLFASIPGLKVVMPTFPDDAKGLLLGSIADNNPVIILEHRWCHFTKGNIKKGYYKYSLDSGPKQITKGKDYTVVGTSYMVLEALEAFRVLKKFDINISIFDLRIVRPLKLKSIINSVKKTKRLLALDTGHKILGIGSEIAAEINEKLFLTLKSPVRRLGLPDHPIPSSRGYLKNIYPTASKICSVICKDLKINKHKMKEILNEISKNKLNKIDVPNPEFQGPF